jgi:RNA polymerase sigma-70 factor (ECF subfamily)
VAKDVHFQVAVDTGFGDIAEDVVQEAFVRAIRYWPKLTNKSDLEPWICTVAINIANRCRRRRSAEMRAVAKLVKEAPAYKGVYGVDFEIEHREAAQERLAAMTRIGPKYRQVLTLSYLYGLSPKEIATLLRLSPGATRVLIHRARKEFLRVGADQFRGHKD